MKTSLKTGWYVLYVKSSHEKKVHQLLQDNHLDSFLPLVKTIRQWSDRKKIIYKPLFPSYVFVNINSSLDFHKACSVKGACSYIRLGKDYALATETEIRRIKLLLGQPDILGIETNVKLPKVGEIKTITYGVLSGLECKVFKVNNFSKIVVQIESLKQNIIAIVPSYYFE